MWLDSIDTSNNSSFTLYANARVGGDGSRLSRAERVGVVERLKYSIISLNYYCFLRAFSAANTSRGPLNCGEEFQTRHDRPGRVGRADGREAKPRQGRAHAPTSRRAGPPTEARGFTGPPRANSFPNPQGSSRNTASPFLGKRSTR